YNDVSVAGAEHLANLLPNRYGVHWVLIDYDSHIHLIFGQGNYTLQQALDSIVPTPIPDILNQFAMIIGRIIIQQNQDVFKEVATAFEIIFAVSEPIEHNDLANIGIDDHHAKYTDVEAVDAVEAVGLALDDGMVITSQDADLTFLFGRCVLGTIAADYAYLAHRDCLAASDFAVRQSSFGRTFLNSKAGQYLGFSIGFATKMRLQADGSFILGAGTAINEFSIDGTLAGNSDDAVPTEQAVKTYIDGLTGGWSGWFDDGVNFR
ncbi:unnamed protein product, partial [marine sediment metagenome]